jgi:hypothetical protein
MTKTAIVVLSDPKATSDESLGRLFNALFIVHDLKEKGRDVVLIFQGAGVRWAAEISKPDHPAHHLYQAIRDTRIEVCGGCADVFGETDAASDTGLPLVRDRMIAGTTGVIDLSTYCEDGNRLIVF